MLRRFFEKNTVDPYLLMVRAWVHMQLNEEHGALGYLKKVMMISPFSVCSLVANYVAIIRRNSW